MSVYIRQTSLRYVALTICLCTYYPHQMRIVISISSARSIDLKKFYVQQKRRVPARLGASVVQTCPTQKKCRRRRLRKCYVNIIPWVEYTFNYEGGGEARDSCPRIWSIRSSTVGVVFIILTCVNNSASVWMVNGQTTEGKDRQDRPGFNMGSPSSVSICSISRARGAE